MNNEIYWGSGIYFASYEDIRTRKHTLCIHHRDSGVKFSLSVSVFELKSFLGDHIFTQASPQYPLLRDIANKWKEVLAMEQHELVEEIPIMDKNVVKIATYRIENGI